MSKSYTSNYLKIYFWQALSVILGIVSLLVVTPYLSGNKELFGIYSICISLTVFFSYADLGFLRSGEKYGAEYYANGELKKEIEIVGFTSFIFIMMMFLISFIILFISIKPNLLIQGLQIGHLFDTARSLFFILALSAPVLAAQRILNLIFGIRLENYKYQRFLIVASVIKILSVFYFFGDECYRLVDYFIFMQIVNLCSVIAGIVYIKRKYGYKYILFFRSIHFSKKIYMQVKGIAFSGLFLSLSWILYYELDQLFIAKKWGVETVAIYGVAFTVLSYFRTFLGVLYTPFSARFYYFIGNDDVEGLNSFFLKVSLLLLPLSVYPIIIVSLLCEAFILSWVGNDFFASVAIVRIIVLCNILAFFTYLSSPYLTARNEIKRIYVTAAVNPLVFWSGVIFTINAWGIFSFVYFKLFSFILIGLVYCFMILHMIKFKVKGYLLLLLRNYSIPIIVCICLCFFVRPYLWYSKSASFLAYNIGVFVVIFLLTIIVTVLTSTYIRSFITIKFKEFIK